MLGLSIVWIEVSATSLLKLQVGDDKIFRRGSYITANKHRIADQTPLTTIPMKHAMMYDADSSLFLPGFYFLPLFALPQKLDYNCLRRIRSRTKGYSSFDDSGSR